MYYSTVASDLFNNNLDIVVARSTNGGKTWGTPVPVYRPTAEFLYIGDKDAIAAGPDPTVKPATISTSPGTTPQPTSTPASPSPAYPLPTPPTAARPGK
jgi:hypothetical protein